MRPQAVHRQSASETPRGVEGRKTPKVGVSQEGGGQVKSPITSLPLPQLYYHSPRQDYYIPDEHGKWICVNESSAKRLVKSEGYLPDENENGISQADQCLLDVQRKQNVAYASRLAGHDAGFYEINGN